MVRDLRVMIRIRIRFRVWLVSCYAHVFVLVSIVVVTLPSDPSLPLHVYRKMAISQRFC